MARTSAAECDASTGERMAIIFIYPLPTLTRTAPLRRRYDEGSSSDLPYVALVNGYLPGGYTVDLPARRIHASAVLDMMERDGFISIETRAIIIDFTLYNANINTFCVVRLTFEMLHTGGVLPFANFRTARLLPYQGDSGNTQLLLDGLVISWVTVVLIIQLRELREAAREPGFTFRGHFGQKWTAYEWVFISLFWGILSMKYYVRSSMAELERFAPFEPNTHYPLHTTGQASLVENNLLAIE